MMLTKQCKKLILRTLCRARSKYFDMCTSMPTKADCRIFILGCGVQCLSRALKSMGIDNLTRECVLSVREHQSSQLAVVVMVQPSMYRVRMA